MVKQFYLCEECNFAYDGKALAKRCESWCKEHKSCNIKITKYSVGEFKSKGGN